MGLCERKSETVTLLQMLAELSAVITAAKLSAYIDTQGEAAIAAILAVIDAVILKAKLSLSS
jgi:hypothetical protein